MILHVVVLACFLACVSASSNFTTYEGHKVYKVFPTESQAGLLKTFHDLEGYDFWGSYHNVSTGIQELDLMVTPEQQEYFVKFLKEKNIEYSTLVEDLETVQKLQIRAYLLQLATNYPTLVTVENIGFTYEGRPIVIAKISSGGQGSRPVIAIEAGIHAREWIAPATAVYIINQLVENSENSDLISNVDWHIVPVTNPDGYEFSHTTTRLWRKTRSRPSSSTCIGTDANRNFDYYWMSVGASSNPCSETYGGTHAFSESETVAYHNYILGNKDRIKLYLATHSYGNVNATGGASVDWVKAVAGVGYAYTIELPGGGSFGFDLPASRILSTVSAYFNAVRVFGEYIRDNYA
uniref:Peptidase M14 domain-containing protein n=1 Tax=Timema monikensis TaxID=170555 RepID=A0A7R9HK67_9NEOP|nr:unnamed protein product [Timema monikensis]